MAVDLQKAAYGIVHSDWSYEILWEKNSMIPSKMMAGGQSQNRFQNARQSAIVVWYHKMDELLKETDGEITLAMSDIFSGRFLDHLSTACREKIVRKMSLEYSGMEGVIQAVNRLKDESKK